MQFTKKNLKNIGKNMAYLREAYGYSSQEKFADALNAFGFTFDMIKKYEGGGSFSIKEKTLRRFSSLVGFSFEQIVYDDLSYLEPGSISLGFDELDTLNSEEEQLLTEIFSEGVKKIFPLFSNSQCFKNSSFAKAWRIASKINIFDAEANSSYKEAINLFLAADCPEGDLNVLSLSTCLYVHMCSFIRKESFENMKKNLLDYIRQMYDWQTKTENIELMASSKRKFFSAINEDLRICMKRVFKVNKCKDFVYYYLGLRYFYGMMDNDETALSEDEMKTVGYNILKELKNIGNKYAIDFFDVISA